MILLSRKNSHIKHINQCTSSDKINDFFVFRFSPGNCSSNNMITNCLNSHNFGIKCVWDNEKAICLPLSEIPASSPSLDFESTYRYCFKILKMYLV